MDLKKGYIVFKVTTANGAIPIEGASVTLSANGETVFGASEKSGLTPPLGFNFKSDSIPFFSGVAKIVANGYRATELSDVKIYKNVTTVRIVNLDRIL